MAPRSLDPTERPRLEWRARGDAKRNAIKRCSERAGAIERVHAWGKEGASGWELG